MITILLIIFIIAWIVSPFVLIPLLIHYKKKHKQSINNINENCKLKSFVRSLIDDNRLSDKEKEEYYKIIEIPYNNNTTIAKDSESVESKSISEVINLNIEEDISTISIPKHEAISKSTKSVSIKNERPKISTISVILVVGVIFVLLSGIVFTTTTWHSLNNIVRSLLIFSASVLFFVVGAIADKKLKLKKTGASFFSIGTFLLPVDVFAMGTFKLFGDWLSWSGEGRYLLGSIACILLGIASYIGTKRYKSTFYASVSLYSISASIGLIVKSILVSVPNDAIFSILIAIYLSTILVLQERLKNLLISLDNTYSLVWNSFYTINVFVLSGISIIISHVDIPSGISMILMSIVLIGYANNSHDNGTHYLVTSLIFITVGMLQAFNLQNFITVITILLIFTILVQETRFIRDSIKVFFNKIGTAILCIGLIVLILDNTFFENWGILSLVSILTIIVCATWKYLKYENRLSLYLQSIYGIFLAINVAYILNIDTKLTVSLILFTLYILYQFIPIFRNNLTLVLYSVILGLLSVGAVILDVYTIIPILWFIALIVNIFKDNDIVSMLSKYIAPLAICLVFVHIFDSVETITAISFYLMLILSVLLNFNNVENMRSILTGYTFTIGYMYYLYVAFNHNILVTLITFSLMVYSIFRVILSKASGLHSKKVIYTNLALIDLVLLFIILDISLIWSAFIVSIIVFVAYYIIEHLHIDDDILIILKYYGIVILEISQWYISLSSGHFIISLIVVLMNFIFAYNFRNNILTLFSIINLYYVLGNLVFQEFTSLDNVMAILIYNIIFFIASGIAGRCFHTEFISRDKKSRRLYIDYFSLFAIIPMGRVFMFVPMSRVVTFSLYPYGQSVFIGFILLSIYPLFYYNRIMHTNSKQILLTISSTALCCAFWSQPFISIPYGIVVEWNCIPILALSLILCIIWKGYPKVLEYSPYIGVCIVEAIFSIYEILEARILEIVLLIGIYIISWIFAGRLKTKKWRCLSVLTFCIVLWIQPIITIPELLITEWNCIPLIVLSISIGRIWIQYPNVMEYLPFITALIVSLILSGSAIESQLIADALILLVSLIIVLIVSFMIKRKKWFVFATIETIGLTVYLTRNFWLSIEWWVYLLLVGLLMISIGATNEYLKLKNESLKGNLKKSTKRLFLDWRW